MLLPTDVYGISKFYDEAVAMFHLIGCLLCKVNNK